MNYRIKRPGFFLLLFILLIYAASSFQISVAVAAQPQITGYSPALPLQHKDIITIIGNNFGTKTQAAPRKWDDFENGTGGLDIANGWTKYSSDGINPKYDTSRVRTNSTNSTKSIKLDFTTGMQYNCSFGLTYTITKVYISGWRYVTTSGGACRNFKPIRIYGNNNEYPDISHVTSVTERSNNLAGWDGVHEINNYFPYQLTTGAWERLEYYFVQSSPGEANGRLSYWRNGVLEKSNTAQKCRDASWGDYYWNRIRFGNFWATDANGSHAYWWWDDVYIDDTIARVEISDSCTWSASRHREIQIP